MANDKVDTNREPIAGLPGQWPFPAGELSTVQRSRMGHASKLFDSAGGVTSKSADAQLAAFTGLEYASIARETEKFVGADGKYDRKAHMESLGLPSEPRPQGGAVNRELVSSVAPTPQTKGAPLGDRLANAGLGTPNMRIPTLKRDA